MSDGDLFDNERAGGDVKRPAERDGGETLFDVLTAPEDDPAEAAETTGTAEMDEGAKIVDATPLPKAEEPPTVCEVPVEPHPERPLQTLPKAASLGASLAELRRRCGLSLRQSAKESRIKEHYIEALEADRISELPQLVFVIGFVKRLCVIYGVSSEDAEALVAELRDHIDYEIPEDIQKSVICREQDEANHRRLRNLTIALAAGAVLIAAALILGGAVLVLKLRNGGWTAAPAAEPEVAAQSAPVTVDEAMLMSYHERPKLKVTRIPAAK